MSEPAASLASPAANATQAARGSPPQHSPISPPNLTAATQRQSGEGAYLLPERGVLIVSLAILGLLVCPILSVVAWAMANRDLKDMEAGRMDRRGYGLTLAGRVVAMLTILALVVVGVVAVFVMLLVIGTNGPF
jgi:hypothetical protein